MAATKKFDIGDYAADDMEWESIKWWSGYDGRVIVECDGYRENSAGTYLVPPSDLERFMAAAKHLNPEVVTP